YQHGALRPADYVDLRNPGWRPHPVAFDRIRRDRPHHASTHPRRRQSAGANPLQAAEEGAKDRQTARLRLCSGIIEHLAEGEMPAQRRGTIKVSFFHQHLRRKRKKAERAKGNKSGFTAYCLLCLFRSLQTTDNVSVISSWTPSSSP